MHELLEWAQAYLLHRDLFKKQIASISKHEHGFTITKKDGSSKECYVKDLLDDTLLPLLKDHTLVVNRNKRENLDWVIAHWARLSALPGLKIIFANVEKNEKWVLLPHSHDKIADPESLNQGLETMFGTIPEE
jgi:hypothetical protein